MSFINWGHESPEQKDIRRRMEDEMMFEQAAFQAATAAAAAGAGGRKKNYVTNGRSSLTSFIEDGEFKYYTYNYDTDTLNMKSTGLSASEYDDRIYVLQGRGFILRYTNSNIRTYVFIDINGEVIREITLDSNDYVTSGSNYDDGIRFNLYALSYSGVWTLYIFNGVSVKEYTLDDVYIDGSSRYYNILTIAGDKTGSKSFISWLNKDNTKEYLALLEDGNVTVIDEATNGVDSFYLESQWNSDFIAVLKYEDGGNYTSAKAIGADGSVLIELDLTPFNQDSLRRSSFYGKNKAFFVLGGNIDNSNDIFAYDYSTNTIFHTNVADARSLILDAYYHYHDAAYPNGLSDYDGDGIIGTTLSTDLLITFWNDIDDWYDGYDTTWYRLDEFKIYTLFDGDTEFGEYLTPISGGFDTFHFSDHEKVIRSFSEDHTIILDGFTWDDGIGRGSEDYKRLVLQPGASSNILQTLNSIDTNKLNDKFFLGSKVIYSFYNTDDSTYYWLSLDSDGASHSDVLQSLSSDMVYYRTHDTMVIIDEGTEKSYMVNQYSAWGFMDIAAETGGVWYNRIFLSDKNGYGDISPTTEYAFYPDNTGWGSLVLLHDIATQDADYGKVIVVKQEGYSKFTLPMTFGATWYGELGRNTFLFICPDINGVFIANLYDLSGNILSSVSIPGISSTYGDLSVWNLDDRAIISIDHDYNIQDYYHYHFGQSQVTQVQVGQQDYWWENDFPAWYN